MNLSAHAFPLLGNVASRTRLAAIGAMFGALPIIAGLIYRTYSISVAPSWLEMSRQIGLLYVIAEIIVILYACEKGLRFRDYWCRLDAPIKALLALFLATFCISSIFTSPLPQFSTFLSLTWICHIGFGVAVHFLIGHLDKEDVLAFAAFLLAGIALFLPLIAVHFVFHPPAETVPGGWLDWGSAIPGFISGRLFGAYAAALAALALGLAWRFDPSARKAFWTYCALTIALACLIWSGTRAALPGLAVALCVGGFVAGRWPSRRFFLLVPICIVAATSLALLLVPYGDERFLLFPRLVESAEATGVHALSSGRLEIWGQAMTAYLRVPIFGAGSGSAAWLTDLEGIRHVQPHNVVVQFLLFWGAPAALFGLTLLGVATWRAHCAVRESPILLPILLMLYCLLTISFLDGTLYFPQFVMLIMACYAACLSGVGRAAKVISST